MPLHNTDQLSPAVVSRPVLLTQLGILTCFCAWTLALPLFPSQDGPIHLLYTAILRSLLVHSGPHFAPYFTIKHLLPPYSLYYYLLMGLGTVVSPGMADKLVVCLYMVSFSLGLRFLARPSGPAGDAMALLATPLLFNWALLTGLTSFLLSTTLVFWAAGLWSRAVANPPRVAPRIWFGVLLFVITLTHPVPLLLLGGFCVLELVLRLLQRRMGSSAGTVEPLRRVLLRDLSLLSGFVISFLYVAHFAAERGATEAVQHPGILAHLKETIRFELELASILPFRGATALPLRLGWLLALCGALVLLIVALRRARPWQHGRAGTVSSTALAWTGMLLFFLLALPFIPDNIGGGHNFAYRMMLYLWISAFAAASMWTVNLSRLRSVAIAMSLLLAALTLALAQGYIRPIAREIAAAPELPASLHAAAGVQLAVPDYREARVALRNKMSFDPFQWAAAGLFRRDDAILLDSPWLEESVLPLGSGPELPAARMPPSAIEDDRRLRPFLEADASAREMLLSPARFVVLVNGLDALPTTPDPLLPGWTCSAHRWYSLCLPPGPSQ